MNSSFLLRKTLLLSTTSATSRISIFNSARRLVHSGSVAVRSPPPAEQTTHFRQAVKEKEEVIYENPMHHPAWTDAELHGVTAKHTVPTTAIQTVAFWSIRAVRLGFDVFSGYAFGKVSEAKLLRRILFLETVAGIPGMVGGALRHLRSLRRVQRDHGWIHVLMAESENERLHALVFSQLKQPGPLFRLAVLGAQGIFWNFFFVAYLISPSFCHSFVGYLEEEAVRTYTSAIEHYDRGELPRWKSMTAPPIAQRYWRMKENASMRDLLLFVRADEAWHRDTNHVLSTLHPDDMNPFVGPTKKVVDKINQDVEK
jgi:hypothetical protein